jgi:hypothetical protein
MERGRNRKYSPSSQFDTLATDIDEHRSLWSQDHVVGFRRGYLYRSNPPPTLINEIQQAGNLGWRLAHEPATPVADPYEHIFNSTVFETLGTFNDAWFDHWQGLAAWPVDSRTPSNPPSRAPLAVPPPLLGLDATKPFTWLTWNNRPYVSHLELMLVPMTSSSQLLQRYSNKASTDPYSAAGSGFSHLANFFQDVIPNPPGPDINISLCRLLDFVEVPSRYVGTERKFVENPAGAMPVFGLTPPFNTYSRFRVPGKVNINTIIDPDLWNGTMGAYATSIPPPAGPFLSYADMDTARRDPLSIEFSRPFRDMTDASVGINGGLLRRGTGTDSLFVYNSTSTETDHNNADRNAYFRYDAIQRLGNLVTTRSSVYAIWITIGYFEVDPVTGDLANPDPDFCELGSDTNDITRHRGFFIIDRSVPVAFQKGMNHNVENMIMVQSYIDE